MSNNPFKVVVVDCPYDSWSLRETRHLFSEMINLKLTGYKETYKDGVLPFDTYDFVATHILVCRDEGGSLKPLTGFKSITEARCKRFNLPFPTTHLLMSSDSPLQAKAVESVIKNCKESGDILAFDSSWTVHPEARRSLRVHHLLQELFISNVVHLHTSESNHRLLGAGAHRVRTDKFFERIGFKRLEASGKPLPTFRQASLHGEEVLLIELERFSSFATEIAKKHQDSWDNRMIF